MLAANKTRLFGKQKKASRRFLDTDSKL